MPPNNQNQSKENKTMTKKKTPKKPATKALPSSTVSAFRDLGDGVPVRVSRCPMCGIIPTAPDDCGMPTPECPNFGKDACARKRKQWEDSWQNVEMDNGEQNADD
jgi:hypothetical protein